MSYDEMKISKLGEACCGCGACAAKCPKSCISMQEDKFGFLHPVIDAGAMRAIRYVPRLAGASATKLSGSAGPRASPVSCWRLPPVAASLAS